MTRNARCAKVPNRCPRMDRRPLGASSAWVRPENYSRDVLLTSCGRETRDGWIGPPWVQTSPARMIFHRIRPSDRWSVSNPLAGVPRVIIADRWDFFTLAAGSSIQ